MKRRACRDADSLFRPHRPVGLRARCTANPADLLVDKVPPGHPIAEVDSVDGGRATVAQPGRGAAGTAAKIRCATDRIPVRSVQTAQQSQVLSFLAGAIALAEAMCGELRSRKRRAGRAVKGGANR